MSDTYRIQDEPRPRGPQLTGRNRESKLVHASGPESLVGQRALVTIERAGPYALVGSLAGGTAG